MKLLFLLGLMVFALAWGLALYWWRRARRAEALLAVVMGSRWLHVGAPSRPSSLDRTVPTVRRVVTPLGPVAEEAERLAPEVSPPDPYVPPKTPEEDR